MTAPERIWIDIDAMYPEQNGGFWWGEECRGIEYVRADLAPTAALAVPEVAALMNDVLEYFRGQSPDLCSGGHYNRDLQVRIAALRGEGQP